MHHARCSKMPKQFVDTKACWLKGHHAFFIERAYVPLPEVVAWGSGLRDEWRRDERYRF